MYGNIAYNDLGQGGYANRITVKVILPKPMPNNNYYATAEVSNAYADFPSINCYIFEKTTTSFDVMLIDNQTGTGKVSGTFKWLIVGV